MISSATVTIKEYIDNPLIGETILREVMIFATVSDIVVTTTVLLLIVKLGMFNPDKSILDILLAIAGVTNIQTIIKIAFINVFIVVLNKPRKKPIINARIDDNIIERNINNAIQEAILIITKL